MKSILASCGCCLLAFCSSAAEPKCQTLEQHGVTLQDCEEEDQSCGTLSKDQANSPSDKWQGCQWPATILKAHLEQHGVIVFDTHVRLRPSFRDSDRMDIRVTIEKPDHTFLKLERKDVPVITENTIPVADIHADADFTTQFDPLGVPTVDATEKGGAKEASHSYR